MTELGFGIAFMGTSWGCGGGGLGCGSPTPVASSPKAAGPKFSLNLLRPETETERSIALEILG